MAPDEPKHPRAGDVGTPIRQEPTCQTSRIDEFDLPTPTASSNGRRPRTQQHCNLNKKPVKYANVTYIRRVEAVQ